MTRRTADPSGTIVLDCEALSLLVKRDPTLRQWIKLANKDDLRLLTSAATLVEATHPRMAPAATRWSVSRITIAPVTEEIANVATELLRQAGLHGHKYAIDAMLCATALNSTRPVTILTSDPDDLRALCGSRATVIKI